MRVLVYAAGALLAVAAIAAVAPARAQTANDVNRLNAAMQICSSPMGAGTPECAKLRGQVGGGVPGVSGAAGMLGKLGGGKIGGMAGLLGTAIGAAKGAPATAPAPSRSSNADIQQAVTMCMKTAGSNPTAIQACLAIASAGSASRPVAYAPSSLPAAGDGSSAIHNNGVEYRDCVTANPGNWQACQQALAAKSGAR